MRRASVFLNRSVRTACRIVLLRRTAFADFDLGRAFDRDGTGYALAALGFAFGAPPTGGPPACFAAAWISMVSSISFICSAAS